MASPHITSADWWNTFLDLHGRDSEEDKAFTGYLTQHGIASTASPDQLDEAYAQFQTWMEESKQRDVSGEPPKEEEPPQPQQMTEPKSSVADPGMEKPAMAATSMKEPEGDQPSVGELTAATEPGSMPKVDQEGEVQMDTPDDDASGDAGARGRRRGH